MTDTPRVLPVHARTIVEVTAVLWLLILAPGGARAERATPEEAERVCQNWLAYQVYHAGTWAGHPNPEIVSASELYRDDTLLARVFKIHPRGYVIIPVLKDLPPIKAYSEESEFDVDAAEGITQLMRDVLSDRLDLFVQTYGTPDAVQPAKGHRLLETKHRDRWERLLVNPERFRADLGSGKLIPPVHLGPLLDSSWHQGDPYNSLCPIGYENDNCRAGCTAIATAQVMKYHEWPPHGEGERTYYWEGDDSCEGGYVPGYELTADFSDAYDWANIPNNCHGGCSEDEEWALAFLCHEVGVACEMDYGACKSLAPLYSGPPPYAAYALKTHFRYDDSIDKEERADYEDTWDWFCVIRDELDTLRPMLYHIHKHSIVCDGWGVEDSEEFYHMNYGWDDGKNQWYAVDHLHCPWSGCHKDKEYLVRYIIPETPLDTIYVDWTYDAQPQDGTADYPCKTLKDGLRKAERRGASYVVVAPGYHLDPVTVPPGVTVLGAGADVTFIGGDDFGAAVTMKENTAISDFTLLNIEEIGIAVELSMTGQSFSISNCIIEDAEQGICVIGTEGQAPTGTIERCIIWGPTYPPETSPCRWGISAQWGDYQIIHNTVDCYCTGILVSNADVGVTNNLLTRCQSGIYCYDASLDEDYNGFSVSGSAVSGTCGAKVEIGEHSFLLDPFFMDEDNHDYRLMAGSPYIDAGSEGQDVGALEFVPSGLVSSPTGLGAEPWGEDGEVRFYWDPVDGAWGYHVYYGLASEPNIYDGTDAAEGPSPLSTYDTSYVLTLADGVEYQLDVSAYDAEDLESDLSWANYATVTPADIIPPTHVTDFGAARGDKSITLSWTNPGGDCAGATVCRSTSSYPADWSLGIEVYSGPGEDFIDSGLQNGTKYYYTAFAYDEVPNHTDNVCGSCTTSAIPADVVPPASPSFTEAIAGDRQVELVWQNPGDSDWAVTRIVRKTGQYPGDHNDGSQVYEGGGTGTTDTGLENDTHFFYAAFARDEVPNWSPVAPEGLIDATTGDNVDPFWDDGDGLDSLGVVPWTTTGTVRLFWNAASDSSSPPVHYNVYYDTLYPAENGTKLEDVSYSAGSGGWDLGYTVDALKFGRRYFFLIRAEDDVGNETDDCDQGGWTVMLEYTTFGTSPASGARYTLSDLEDVSYGAVEWGTPPSEFYMFGNLTISAYDTLVMDSNETLISTDVTGYKKLRILGSMEADGTPETGWATLTGVGISEWERWGGLEFQDPGSTSHLYGVIVEKAYGGIVWNGGAPQIDQCVIRWITGAGLEADCDSWGSLTVTNTTVWDCGGRGLNCHGPRGSQVWIENNTARNCGGTGIDCDGARLSTVTVAQNTVYDCEQNGINCDVSDSSTATIEFNVVRDNGGGGILLDLGPASTGWVTENEAYRNLSGLSCAFTGDALANNLLIDRNTVYENSGEGLSIGRAGALTIISNNQTTDNDIGIDFIDEAPDTAAPFIYCNTVTGNTTAGIRCGTWTYPRIDSCLIANNTGAGILSVDGAYPTVTASTITGNGAGVVCDSLDYCAGWVDLGKLGDSNPLNDGRNRIYDNTTHDVEIHYPDPLGILNVPAEGNWWGTGTTQEMLVCGVTLCDISTLWDNWDDPSLATVDYVPYYTSSGSGTAPTITLTSPGPGSVLVDTAFTVSWTDADPEQDATISLSYYRDPDSLVTIPGASSLSEDDSQDSFVWNTATADTGTFHLFARISDGWASDSSSSPGTLTIGHPFMDVDTASVVATLRQDSTLSVPLLLESAGAYALTFQFSDRDSTGLDASWVSEMPSSGTLAPDSSLEAHLTLDATGLATGLYEGEVLVASNDPWDPERVIDIELTVRAPDVALSDSSNAFGVASLGDTLGWVLTVANSGDDTLHLYSGSVSLPDYGVDPPLVNWAVTPGESAACTVRFAPTEIGDRVDTLWIHSDDPEEGLLGVALSGIGMSRFVLSPASLDFGEVALFGSGSDSLWALNGDTTSFSLVAVGVGGLPFTVLDPGVPKMLAPGESLAVTVGFSAMLQGSFDDTLTLTTDHVPPLEARVNLHGDATLPEIFLTASEMDFGMVAVGDTATAGLWVRNLGVGHLLIEGAGTSNPVFSVSGPALPDTVPEGDSTWIGLRFAPVTPESVADTLVVSSNDPFQSTVRVSLAGIGPVPDIHVSQTWFHLGEAVAGVDTTSGDILITNRGMENVEVTGLWLPDSGFTLLTGAPLTVAPGDTGEVALLFHPEAEWLYVGTLSIASNDPDAYEDTVAVTVSGDGVIPVLTVSADSLIAIAFESGTAEETVEVQNEGTGTLLFHVTESDSVGGEIAWLSVAPESGAVAAGDTLALLVGYDASPVTHAVHYGRLLLSSNDPGDDSEIVTILRVPRMHYADLDTGNVRLTVTDGGAFGFLDKDQYLDYGGGYYGNGFHFPADGAENHLFTGSIWLGIDSTYVADATYDYDWRAVDGGDLAVTHEGGTQVARATLDDANGAGPLGLTVHFSGTAAPHPPDDDFVLIELEIENTTATPAGGLYAGIYLDWDTGRQSQNEGGYCATERLGYMHDPAHPESACVGIVALDPYSPTSFRLVHHPTYVYPYGEIRDEDAFAFMADGIIDSATFEPNDWSMVMARGAVTLAPGERTRLVVAIVGGAGLTDLRLNAQQARVLYGCVHRRDDLRIVRYDLSAPYPNPFNPTVHLDLFVPEPGGRVSVAVYDVRGRLVSRIFQGDAKPGVHLLVWRGQNDRGRSAATGIYFVRMVAGEEIRVRKAVLLK